jgi:HlyD family secretion protein
VTDREIAPEVRRRRMLRRVATVVIAIAAIAFSFGATIQWLRPSVRRTDLQFARVERGSVDATLQGSGTIVPAVEQVVSSPVDARVLRIERRAGDHVHAGDELVTLDTSASRLDVDRLAGSLATRQSEQLQLQLKLDETLANLRAQIEQKKLDSEIFHLKAEQNAKMHAAGLVSQQDDMAAATAAKKSDIELAQLGEALTRAQRSSVAQLAAVASELTTLKKERDQSQRQLDLAMMRADRDGVVTSIVIDSGSTVRRGDIVARLADLSSFAVDASISDLHAAELSAGMPVQVRLDEETTLAGAISSIEPRIENGAVKFHVALVDRSNRKLRNNVRVDVYPVTSHRANILRVSRGALGSTQREDVYVVRGSELVRVSVQWGLAGQQYMEPISGLAAGDEVVISNMNDYAGVKALRLK